MRRSELIRRVEQAMEEYAAERSARHGPKPSTRSLASIAVGVMERELGEVARANLIESLYEPEPDYDE